MSNQLRVMPPNKALQQTFDPSALQPMTDSKSLRQIESLLEKLPGISDAGLVHSESSGTVVGVVHCTALPLHPNR